MGPPQAEEMMRDAYTMGADDAVILSDRKFAGADVLATSYALAQGIQVIGGADLIICGRQTTDGDTAQVGPAIAEHLTIPHAAWVAEIVDVNEKAIPGPSGSGQCISDIRDTVSVSSDNRQRYLCTASAVLSAKKATADRPIRILSFENMPDQDLSRYGLVGSPTSVERMFAPPEGEKQVYLEGSAKEKAEELFSILTGKKII